MPDSKPTPEPESAPEPKREPREPGALSAEYHKARKQLMLWAAVLFIWELVGIDLEKAKEAGGNFGAIIGAIKSPQAVPWALLILVGYFLFKVTVEWYQCSLARRSLRVSGIDFTSAWIVALLAYVLYAYQAISRVQFADLLQDRNKIYSLIAGTLLGAVVVQSLFQPRDLYFPRWIGSRVWTRFLPSILGIVLLVGLRFINVATTWTLVLVGAGSGAIVAGLPIVIIRFDPRKGSRNAT